MKKNIVIVVSILVIMLSFAGCESSSAPAISKTDIKETSPINTDSYRATSGRLSNGAPINVDYVREGCMGWQEAAKYAVQYAKNHSWYGYCPWNESSYYIEYFAENDNYYLIGINSSTEDIYNGRHFFSGAWTNYKVNNRTGKVTAFGGGPQGWESSDKNKEFYYYWSDLAKSLF